METTAQIDIDSHQATLDRAPQPGGDSIPEHEVPAGVEIGGIGKLSIPVAFEIDSARVRLDDLAAFGPGSVITLDMPVREALVRLVCHDQVVGIGRLIVIGEQARRAHRAHGAQPGGRSPIARFAMTPLSSVQGLDPVSLFIALMALAVLPFAAMVVTSYTKVVVVLGLLRNALGIQQVPPNMVLNGIAIIISIYVMAPVAMEAADQIQNAPPSSQTSNTQQLLAAASAAKEPFRQFLVKHAHPAEKAFFLKSAQAIWPQERAKALLADDLIVVAPAFLLTSDGRLSHRLSAVPGVRDRGWSSPTCCWRWACRRCRPPTSPYRSSCCCSSCSTDGLRSCTGSY